MGLTYVTVCIGNLTHSGEPYENVAPILGVVALENTDIGVDFISRTLKRMAAKPLKPVIARVGKARQNPE